MFRPHARAPSGIHQSDVPPNEWFAEEHPNECAEREIGAKGQLRRPDPLADNEGKQTDEGPDQRTSEDTEQDRAPPEKCSDAREKFQIAAAHGFARNFQLADDAADSIEGVEGDLFGAEVHPVVMKPKIGGAKIALGDDGLVAMQNELVGFARKIIAPQTLFFADHEIGVVTFARPTERRRPFEFDSFLAENFFASLEHQPEQHVTKNSG